MKIGIIGSGGVGGMLGKLWAKAGHEVLFSSRHPEKLASLVTEAGASSSAGMVAEAAAHREGDQVAIAMAGDDEGAKQTVAELIKDAGYVSVDIGTLDESQPLDPDGVLWNSVITEAEIRQRLEQ